MTVSSVNQIVAASKGGFWVEVGYGRPRYIHTWGATYVTLHLTKRLLVSGDQPNNLLSRLHLLLDYHVNYGGLTDIGALRRMTNIAREDGLASWFGTTQTLFVGPDGLGLGDPASRTGAARPAGTPMAAGGWMGSTLAEDRGRAS